MNITLSPELEHITEIKEFVQDKTNFNTHSKYFSVDNIKIYLDGDASSYQCLRDLHISYKICENIEEISNHLKWVDLNVKLNKVRIIDIIDDFHTVLEHDKDKLEERMDNKEMFLQEIHNKHKDKV